MIPWGHYWIGPGFCLAGCTALAVQVYAYLEVGFLSSGLLGGGAGLILIGAITWFHAFDDRGEQLQVREQLPSADEFDQGLQETDDDPVPQD